MTVQDNVAAASLRVSLSLNSLTDTHLKEKFQKAIAF